MNEKSYTTITCFCGCGKVVDFCPEVPEGYNIDEANKLSGFFKLLVSKGYTIQNRLGCNWMKNILQNPCPNGHFYRQSDHS